MKKQAPGNWILPLLIGLALVCAAAPVLGFQEEKAQPAPKEAAVPGALAPAQTLSGSIAMVDASKKLLIVKGAAEVTYSFVLTGSTRITAGKERLKAADLSSRVGQKVTVRFVPTRTGNIARSVEVGG